MPDQQTQDLSFQDYKLMRAGKLEPPKEEVQEEVNEEPAEQQEEEPLEQSAESEEKQEKPKAKGGFQRRIDKLTARNHRLETENSDLASRLEAIERRLGGASQAVQEKADDSKPDPQKFLEQGKTHEEYVEAIAKWAVKQEREAQKREEETQSVQAYRAEVIAEYNKKASEARGKYEDFDEVLAEKPENAVPPQVLDAIVEAENGPDIAYYLAKNPEVTKSLWSMSPIRVIAEIGKISAKLMTSGEKTSEKRVSKAPPPPAKVPGGTALTSKSVDEMTFQEYKAFRKKN